MKFHTVLLSALAAFVIGCNQEPETPREKAEQAQKELEEAREDAAEMIADAEEDAVETVSDAREEADDDLQKTKRKAAETVEDAEQNLEARLDQLSDPRFVEDNPPVTQEEEKPIILQEDVDSQDKPRVRVEIEGTDPDN